MIPAVWRIGAVANIWTKARSPSTLHSASLNTKWQFNRARMCPAVHRMLLFWLVPIQRSTISFLDGLCFLHLVDPVQRTIWTACSSHWKEVTGIDTALYRMCFALLRRLKHYMGSTWSVKFANLLSHKAMWFCRSPFGIAHHSAKSSRVLISGRGFLSFAW